MNTGRKSFITKPALSILLVVLVVGVLLIAPAAASTEILVDFEGGLPEGWFDFSGGGASVAADVQTIADLDPLARPGQVGDNTLLESTFDATSGFAGFGQSFENTSGPQDWINNTGVSFWFYGSGSGQSLQFEIQDNRSDPNVDTAERFDVNFLDDFTGWQKITLPFSEFTRATDFQPGGAPNDGLTLTEMWGWAVVLDGAAGTLYMDDIGLELAIVDDFESGLPAGEDGDGNLIGFFIFEGPDASVSIITTDSPPAPVPDTTGINNVLQVDSDVPSNSWGGAVHAFENDTVDTWVTQDWSGFDGLSFWLYGNNTGSTLFIDVLDNRAPGTSGDTAERYSVDIPDNFSGWQLFEIPFDNFNRKEIGNGAPNDGFTLTQIHGYAFGIFSAGQAFTNYLDDVSLFGIAEVPELAVSFFANNYDVEEGTTGDITVKLNRAMNSDDPAQVSVDYLVEPGTPIPGLEYTPAAGTLTFVNGGLTELSFPLETFDDDKYEGDERVILRLTNPVDVAPGFIMQAAGTIVENDLFDPALVDDFERGAYLLDGTGGVQISTMEIAADDPLALPEQGAYESILKIVDPVSVEIKIQDPLKCHRGRGVVPIAILTTENFDATTVDHATVTFDGVRERQNNKKTGEPVRREVDVDDDGDLDLLFLFRLSNMGPNCENIEGTLQGKTFEGQFITSDMNTPSLGRDFAIGEDWSEADGLQFWYYGQNSGAPITVVLKDNRAPDPGPSEWSMVWSDEFNDRKGTPPNPENWAYELGDGTINGIPGWGNDELQYYTDSTENAATDGKGSLVITTAEADGSLLCYYGPCEYSSARLISLHKNEFAYGRIETRILVPQGDGLWPAFWSLGTDIGEVGWPQTGEIDIMEFVGREPFEVFGTIHGPGYSGGSSFGDTYTFRKPVYLRYHTFTIEWGPDEIHWYVDGINYHNASPADVAPNEWVFNHPFYLLLNVAVGGNFGGPVGDDTTFPQRMLVDYVRVYQGPDIAERFETAFTDDFSGWQLVELPFDSFARSTNQPDAAPDDGLGLTEVWGYEFELPENAYRTVYLDQVRLDVPPTTPQPGDNVIDDFEDGNSSDWGFFGGNNAGGGGGVLDDRPQEGTYYFSTGWGGGGSNSVFYGGMFKNLPDTDQVEPPADPWFNVWVLNQSDATADQYTLEITIREDLDGNGWTNGAEDSFRFDTTFASSSFDDQWTLVSAPLSDFTDLFTGGDGTFDGNLDEVVVVISGVQGADGATVEVDFDYFAFSSGGPLEPPPSDPVFDDFEDGESSDWGFFGGNNAGGGGGVLDDRPQEGSYYFSTGWGGGGSNSVFYGGMFKNLPDTDQVEPPADPWFNVWVLNQSDATADQYTLEITIREDLDGNGWTDGAEDSFRLDTTFTSSSFDDQWTLVSAPLSDFTDLFTGGDGTFDGNLDEVVVVISGVQGADGATVEVDFDYFAFSSGGPLEPPPLDPIIDDFEDGDSSDWFFFGGNAAGGGGGVLSDRPQEGDFYFSTGWGGGGTASGFYGGMFKNFPEALQVVPPADPWFNVWVLNQSDATVDQYTLEITIREDLDGNGWTNGAEDSFRLDTTFASASFDDQWTLISAPLSAFTDLFTGGDGTFDGNLDEVVVVVGGVQGADGSAVEVDFDLFTFSSAGPLEPLP